MKTSEVLNKQLEKIKLSVEEKKELEKKTQTLIDKIKSKLKKNKIKAEVFVGGSLSKQTLMKKQKHDIDLFVRFDRKYKDEEISRLLERVLKNARRVHGSRDYFQIKDGRVTYEIVPVAKISKPGEMRNVTDLSYFHVSYVMNKIRKSKNLANEIILAKSFCFNQGVYGAESYIRGFSGYALELLIIYYGGFVNFLKKIGKEKLPIVIDPKKFYKNKQDVMNSMNEAKLSSPIIFVDPTFKERNALAALSYETFGNFVDAAKRFLKKPSTKFFEPKTINPKDFNLILHSRTNKQTGDIAGSKLFKFYKFVKRKLGKYFDIKKSEFEYDEKQIGRFYFYVKPKKEIIIIGPPISNEIGVSKFTKKWKKVFVKNKRAYTKLKPVSAKKFLSDFKKRNKDNMKAMGITGLQ